MTPRDALCARAVAWFADNGIGDTSLRTLAAGIGTSHRMLLYHFGSRQGLLAAVVEAVERSEQAVLAETITGDAADPGWEFWTHVADTAQTFAPLFFELSSHAMRAEPHAGALRSWLAHGWVPALAAGFEQTGWAPDDARTLAHLSVATARGVLFELAVTGDRAAADRQMAAYAALVQAHLDTGRRLPLQGPTPRPAP